MIEFQRLYFENDFIQKDINEIKIISKESNELKIKKFEFKMNNNKIIFEDNQSDFSFKKENQI